MPNGAFNQLKLCPKDPRHLKLTNSGDEIAKDDAANSEEPSAPMLVRTNLQPIDEDCDDDPCPQQPCEPAVSSSEPNTGR